MTAVMRGEGSPCEQPIDTLPRFKNVFGTARRFSTSREQRGATRSEQNWKPSRNRPTYESLKVGRGLLRGVGLV